jgi:hypothetical protein
MVLSLVLIAWGWYGPGLSDGLPTLIMLWIFGKSKKRIDNLFWYLGLGFPLFILVWLFIG